MGPLSPDAIKEDGQVMMVVELLNIHLPADHVLHTLVLYLNGQVTTVVECPENCVGWVLSGA